MVLLDLTQENNKEMRYYSYSSSFREHFRVKQKINQLVHTFNLNSKHLPLKWFSFTMMRAH